MRALMKWTAALILLGLLVVGVYFLPPVHQRLSWRLASLQTRLHYLLNPPDQAAFLPKQQGEAGIQATLTALSAAAPAATRTRTPAVPGFTPTITALPAALTPALTLTPTATAIPAEVALSGIRYQYQTFNNCGPANLAMALSFWGWAGDQHDTQALLRPNPDDANVMPEEMLSFVAAKTGLKAVLRYGGDLAMLKRLVAAGFPVIIEMGHQPKDDWWMGHYAVVSGYSDSRSQLILQDTLVMPDFPMPYAEIQAHWWRDFNSIYLVIYPPAREAEVMRLLGPNAGPLENRRLALEKARLDSTTAAGRELFFDFYNQGDLLLANQDYTAAAEAYDVAFSLYNALDEKQRPWRTLWYRPGPYQAYYQLGRYQDSIDLANSVLNMLSKRGLEESHYARGLAYEALGQPDQAIFDYQIAIKLRPNYEEAAAGIQRLGGK